MGLEKMGCISCLEGQKGFGHGDVYLLVVIIDPFWSRVFYSILG